MHDDSNNEIRAQHEEAVDQLSQDLTDEQLQQLAEGANSWGANCNNSSSSCA